MRFRFGVPGLISSYFIVHCRLGTESEESEFREGVLISLVCGEHVDTRLIKQHFEPLQTPLLLPLLGTVESLSIPASDYVTVLCVLGMWLSVSS